MKALFLVATILAAVAGQVRAQVGAQEPKLNPNNIDQVVEAMTLQEKARLLVGRNDPVFGGYAETEEPFTRIIPTNVAGYTQAIPRLGIPATALADGPVGLVIVSYPESPRQYTATGFPSGTLMACSWDVTLNRRVGEAMGNEALEHGVDVILAPGMNIHRSPLGGRNYEYYSEDPLLTGKMAAALVRGVQSNGVGTSLKHFAANSQETNRTGVDEIVSQRALREIYLKGFEIAVKESHPWTVMSSYNRLNGPYTQENRELLTTVLRDEWGFDGIVMTDWIQIRNTAAQIQAGNDLMEPGYQVQIDDIVARVRSGELSVEDVDVCVRRVLEYIVKTPHFRGHSFSHTHDQEGHARLAREAATQGMVLLKNDGGALPLGGEVKRVALFGRSSYDFLAGGTGSGNVVKPYVVNLAQGLSNAGLEPSQEMEEVYEKYIEYVGLRNRFEGVSLGRSTIPEMTVARGAIERQAAENDVAILTIGRQAGEGGDRTIKEGYNLTAGERELMEDVCDAFHAAGKRVVVVLNVGGAVETSSWKGLPDAILMAWQPGQQGGNAVADILTGAVNPSGKLSMTLSVSAMDHPSSANFPLGPAAPRRGNQPRENVDYTLHREGIWVGYRYFNTAGKEVSYPFGHGLSYTDFSYSRPTVRATGDGFRATVTVTNTGKVAGRESVQLYVSAPAGELDKPLRELRAFAKTGLLQPGQSEVLTFEVADYDLASFDERISAWVAPRGRYTVGFGASVEDIHATGAYTLGREFILKVNDVLRPTMELK